MFWCVPFTFSILVYSWTVIGQQDTHAKKDLNHSQGLVLCSCMNTQFHVPEINVRLSSKFCSRHSTNMTILSICRKEMEKRKENHMWKKTPMKKIIIRSGKYSNNSRVCSYSLPELSFPFILMVYITWRWHLLISSIRVLNKVLIK